MRNRPARRTRPKSSNLFSQYPQDGNPDWPTHVRDILTDLKGRLIMAFKRDTSPLDLRGQALTEAMVGIGMLFAEKAAPEPNIEDTLVAASVEGMDRDDLRVLAILVTWIGVHQRWINVDRLVRAVEDQSSARVRAFWAAIATWLVKDRRFARLERLHQGPRIGLLRAGSDFQIKRNGEDPRFAESALRVPAGTLRDRARDVLSPPELAQRHGTYRHRVLMGPPGFFGPPLQ